MIKSGVKMSQALSKRTFYSSPRLFQRVLKFMSDTNAQSPVLGTSEAPGLGFTAPRCEDWEMLFFLFVCLFCLFVLFKKLFVTPILDMDSPNWGS